MTAPSTVVLAVLTYQRVAAIETLVPLLLDECCRTVGLLVHVEVLIVDNDASCSARPAVNRALAAWTRSHGSTVGLRYVVEPRPGIAAARNRVLDESEGRDFLAFIDDDERPSPGWLGALLDTAVRYGADGVAGRTITQFPLVTDRWIIDGGFLDRRHRIGLRTGDSIGAAATNNLLLDLRTVRRIGVRFDERFGHSGGEDSLFTTTLLHNGARIVWCDEAVVHDYPAAERMTRSWMLRRVFGHGVTDARVAAAIVDGHWARVRERITVGGRGVARLLIGAQQLAVGVLTRRGPMQARGAQRVARGLGMIAGSVGHVHIAYRRPPE